MKKNLSIGSMRFKSFVIVILCSLILSGCNKGAGQDEGGLSGTLTVSERI